MERTGASAAAGREQDLSPGTSLLDNAGMPDGPNDGTFSIGPAQPVEDSRQLPAVTPQDEADTVSALHASDVTDHPDNVATDTDLTPPAPDAEAGEPLPGEDELAAVVADVDLAGADPTGFDDTDLPPAIDLTGTGDAGSMAGATSGTQVR